MSAARPGLDYDARRRRFQRYGLLACTLFLLLLVVAATLVQITGAVSAVGYIVQTGENKSVQHVEGGPVAEILVREGQQVSAGEPLVRLDGAQIEAQYRVSARRQFELLVRLARLVALEQDQASFAVPTFAEAATLEGAFVREVVATQRAVFDSTRQRLDGMQRRLTRRASGLAAEIAGLERQVATNREQVALLDQEIAEIAELVDDQLVSKARLTALMRQRVAVQGEIAALHVSTVRSSNALQDARHELEVMNREYRENLWREIERDQAELEEVSASRAAAADRLARLLITAPASGRVHELEVRNVNAVIAPGAVIMQIVPVDAGPVLNARLGLIDIDQVYLDQDVRIRFDTFDLRTTPEINGKVVRISADRSVEPESGESYFEVLVDLPAHELARLEGKSVTPGMPATAMFTTNERSLLDYLTKPLRTQLFAAFREE